MKYGEARHDKHHEKTNIMFLTYCLFANKRSLNNNCFKTTACTDASKPHGPP